MARDLKLGIRLTADGKGFVGEVRVAKKQLNKLTGASVKTARATDDLGSSFAGTHKRLGLYAASYVGLTQLLSGGRALVRHADSYTQISNAIRIATSSAAEHAQVQTELFAIAQRTRSPLASVADVYQKMSISAADLGASTQQMLEVIEGVGQALVINGTSTEAASGALLQFGQALGSGTVQAEEYNSILDGLKPVLVVAAKHLEVAGGSVGKLKKAVASGQVTSKAFFAAFRKGLPELQANFDQANSTIGQGVIQVDNALTLLIGRLDETQGVSTLAADKLEGLAEAIADIDVAELSADLEDIATVGGYLLLVFLGKATLRFSAYALSQAKAAAGNIAFAASAVSANRRAVVLARSLNLTQAATVRLAIGMRAATFATRGLRTALGFLTGPAGLLLLAGYAAYEFATANDRAAESLDGLPGDIDAYADSVARLTEQLKAMTDAERAIEREALVKRIESRSLFGLFGDDGLEKQLTDAELRLASLREQARAAAAGEAETIVGNFGFHQRRIRAPDAGELREARDQAARLRGELTAAQQALSDFDAALATLGKTEGGGVDRQFDDFGVALDAGEDFKRLQQSLRTELEKINASYATQAEKIRANTQAGSAARAELLGRIEVQCDAATAALARKAAEEQARQAQASGLPALALLAERTAELAQVTDFSAEALRRQADRTRIAADVQNHYRDATQATIQALIEARVQEAALLRIQELKTQAFETVKGAHLRYVEEIAALEALRGDAQADQGLIEIELERLKAEQILEVKRGYWEQELLEAEGFRSREAAEGFAHKERLIAIESRYARRVGQVQTLIARYEATKGTERLQTGLEIAKQSAANFAGQSQTAFRISQAAAIAQAIVATHKGVTEALGSGPPPANFILAALVGAAGAAEIAAIRSQPPPQGFARGGIIDSPTFFTARNVRHGVAGEAGPEAILPVTRLRSGGFGVDAASAGNTVHLSFAPVIQVSAPAEAGDPVEFSQMLALQLRRTLEPVLNRWARDQHRAGGVFNPTDRV